MAGLKKAQLGIHFGQNAISVVESSGALVRKSCRQDLSFFSAKFNEIAEDEIKFAAVLQKILRENEFSTRDVSIALPEHDCLVRFFEIPPVSKKELASTINFEARKYIPFRIEELVYDTISWRSRSSRNLDIFFVAIKTKTIDHYIKVLNQVGFNIISLEPASLSFLRAAFAKGRLSVQRSSLIVDIDAKLSEGDIIILDAGVPCFIRDITLSPVAELEQARAAEETLAKLINEIRISIDYFRHRHTSLKNDIAEIFIFSEGEQLNAWAQLISQELGIRCSAVSPATILKFETADCDSLKAAGASLRGALRFPVDVTLFKKETKVIKAQSATISLAKSLFIKPAFKKYVGALVVSIIIIIFTSVVGNARVKVLQKRLNVISTVKQQIIFLPKSINFTEAELSEMQGALNKQLKEIEATIKERVYATSKIGRIPALLVDGIWLDAVSLRKNSKGIEMTLDGVVYLPESENAIREINIFLNKLRSDGTFREGLSDIVLVSARQAIMNEFEVRSFQIQCK
jgi:Tfp pilus assembly PilM family ATPase